MSLRQGRLAVLLLLPAGVLAAHAVGYAGAGHSHSSAAAHGYLSLAMALAAPLALLAVLWSMVGDRPATGMPFGRVLALQWAALLFQESTESLVAGYPLTAILSSRPLWLALVAQLAVAAGAVLLLRSACAVGARLASLPRVSPLVVTALGSVPRHPVAASPRWRPRLTLPARAPPLIVAG